MKAVSFLSMRHLDMHRTSLKLPTLKLPTESTEPTKPTQPIRFVCPCPPLSLDADMEEFEVSHPKDWIGPCFMSEKDFNPKFLQLVECEALAAGLPPLVCLSGPTLQCSPIPSDDRRSCAPTPLRTGDIADSHGNRCPCGEQTQFGFYLCSNCHFMEGRRRAKQRAVQVAPSTGAHICWLCKQHPTQSPVHLCTECFERAS